MTDAFLGFQNVTWDKKRNTAKYDLKMWWQHIGNPMKEREREREMEAKWRRGKAKKQPSAFHGMFPWHASMRYLSCVLDCILISSSFKLFEWRAWNDSAELDSTLQLGPHRSKAFPRVDWSCPICPCSVSEISVDLILFPHLLQTSKSAWSEAWGYALCCCCCWLLVVGCGLLVVGCWLLVVGCCCCGCWLLVVGCWLLLVVGCWLLVVGCWLLLLLFVGCWLLVVGCCCCCPAWFISKFFHASGDFWMWLWSASGTRGSCQRLPCSLERAQLENNRANVERRDKQCKEKIICQYYLPSLFPLLNP